MNIIIKAVMAVMLLAALAGCQHTGPASLAGECAAFQNPGFAVQGKRRMDQQAVDRFLETGIVTCGWPRPKS